MNISELKSQYKANPGPTSGKNLAMLQYIEDLASRTATNIAEWDAGIFVDEGNIVTVKTKINKIFFERKDQSQVSVVQEVDALQKELNDSLNKHSYSRIKQALDGMKKRQAAAIKEATDHYKNAAELIQGAYKLIGDIAALEGGQASTFGDQVMEVLRTGLLSFQSFDGTILRLTTQDIINTEVNPTAGLDLRVNLGQFLFSIDIKTMRVLVLKHKNNIMVGEHYHPHVGAGGDLCQGNASASYASSSVEGRIGDLLQLIITVMQTYNPANPYKPLAKFHEASPRKEERYRVEAAKAEKFVGKGAAPMVEEDEDEIEECEECGESREDCSC